MGSSWQVAEHRVCEDPGAPATQRRARFYAALLALAIAGGSDDAAAITMKLPRTTFAASLVARVTVTCRVVQEGNQTVTYYCCDGYICDNAKNKCKMGSDLRDRFQKEVGITEDSEAAHQSYKAKNKWSGKGDDCESAGEFERQTAAWYYACVVGNTKPASKSSHKPKIDPAELSRRANAGCRGQANAAACVARNKQEMILAADPGIRDACAGRSGIGFSECVDRHYLYGPDARHPKLDEMRERLFAADKARRYAWKPGDRSKVDTEPKPQGCPPGSGMKPDPDAFGAWTCQPLGVVLWPGRNLDLDAPAAYPQDGRAADAAVDAFEDRLNRLLFDAAASAAQGEAASKLSASERDRCVSEGFEAVRSVFKGGVPAVSEACREVANGARAEVMRRASHGSDDASVQELFASLTERSKPAMQERQDDCRRGGLSPDEMRKCLIKSIKR